MSNQPLAKGRVCYASEYYPTNERDQNGKPKMKARYATLGRATMWPAERQGEPPQISIDLDSMPIGSTGAIKMMVFWDRTQPNGKNLNNLANAFKTTSTWILTGKDYAANTGNVSEAPAQYNTKSLPILSHVQAGIWTEALDYRGIGDEIEWEDAPSNASDNAFWLRVVGDSMTNQNGVSINEGMLILVDPDVPAENGKLVVAKLEGTDEATFKKLVIDAGMKFLKPLNPTYPTIPINGNCQIVGVVREAKVKL